MRKRMLEVAVQGTDGYVEISQDDTCGNQPAVILLHPDQVDTIVAWLQEARAEIRGVGRQPPRIEATCTPTAECDGDMDTFSPPSSPSDSQLALVAVR